VSVVNGQESDREKHTKLMQIIDSSVDVDGVARFCLGAILAECIGGIAATLHTIVPSGAGQQHRGQARRSSRCAIKIGGAQQRDETAAVRTVLGRPNNPPTNVDWINHAKIGITASDTIIGTTRPRDEGEESTSDYRVNGTSGEMKINRVWKYGIPAAAFAAFAAAVPGRLDAQDTTARSVQIGESDFGGVVTSANGPEGGVWVIAETSDLPTKFARSSSPTTRVVT
jgi:hypothetical protein